MREILFSFSLALTSTSVFAETSIADLSSDTLIEGATAEIRSMKLNELETTIEYIAACMQPLSAERNYHCSRLSAIASIKFDRAPQFSKLTKAVFLAELKSSEPRVTGSFESIGVSTIELRRSSIFFGLQNAARERYQKLAK